MRVAPAGVIERWQPHLDAIAPQTREGLSHFRLVWEPGEDWAPVERWTIWEVMPAERSPMGVFEDLHGPPPRAFGRYDDQLGRFVRSRNFHINQHQWEFFQETGMYGRPVWIIQGEKGGHKRFWNDTEQNLIRLHKGTKEVLDPPAPGELCYALPDWRTIAAIAELGVVARFGELLHYLSHDRLLRDSLDRREAEVAAEMADRLWSWLGDQVEEALDAVTTRKDVNAIWDVADADGEVIDWDAKEEYWKQEVAGAAGF